MAAIQEFMTDILLELPAVPRPVAMQAIRSALSEFSRESHVWRVDVYPIAIGANETEIEVTPDQSDLKVIGIHHAWLDNVPLPVKTAQWMDEHVDSWRGDTATTLQALVATSASMFRPWPTLTESLTKILKLQVAVIPTEGTAEVDDDIFDQWYEGIAAGAKYRLMMMPGKPWSAPEHAQFHRKRFEDDKSRAKLRAYKGYGGAVYAGGKLPGVV